MHDQIFIDAPLRRGVLIISYRSNVDSFRQQFLLISVGSRVPEVTNTKFVKTTTTYF
jgi:hypothetical protein